MMNLLAFTPSIVDSDTTTSHSEPPAGTSVTSTHTITLSPSMVSGIVFRDTVTPEKEKVRY